MKIILTGCPGTGKSFFGKWIAKKFDLKLIEEKNLIKKYKIGIKKGKEIEVNLKKLKKAIEKELKGKKNFIVIGHLISEIKIPAEKIIVLRVKPMELEKRLKARGYSEKKIKENVLAEALDYCFIKAKENYDKVVQIKGKGINTTKNKLNKAIKGNYNEKVDYEKDLKKLIEKELKKNKRKID